MSCIGFKYFSPHSVGCLFVLFMVSLIRSHLFLFLLSEMKPKDIATICVRECLPMPSSKSFIVSSLIFRSLIYFELIFVCGVRECSNFILLHGAVQF